MTPEIALLIGQALLKYGPYVARGLTEIFYKQSPSMNDWVKVFDLAEKPYEAYVSGQQVPKSTSI